MNEKRSLILLVLCILIMAGVCVGLFFLRSKNVEAVPEVTNPVPTVVEKVEPVAKVIEEKVIIKSTDKPILGKRSFEDVNDLVQDFQVGLRQLNSEEDLKALFHEYGLPEMDESQIQSLYNKIGKGGVNLSTESMIDEIGELKRREKSRMAINLKDGSRIFFDVAKGEDGKWGVEKFYEVSEQTSSLDSILEDGNMWQKDGLTVAYSFVKFAIQQEFSKAKKLTDEAAMSDVEFAGLCILFEEGGYTLRVPRGVLTSISRPKSAGYSVYIVDKSGAEAQFSLILSRSENDSPWRVTEMNFNTLLSDYIAKNGGDRYYTPFVKNPKGGDSIVVYFDFNINELSDRTKRQLSIVADILKLDENKKLTLTGHTDALGSAQYNEQLSQRRAEAVRDYLVSEGVIASQITTKGFGMHRPRKANTLADGSDNPEGRQANRRAEIYLDF